MPPIATPPTTSTDSAKELEALIEEARRRARRRRMGYLAAAAMSALIAGGAILAFGGGSGGDGTHGAIRPDPGAPSVLSARAIRSAKAAGCQRPALPIQGLSLPAATSKASRSGCTVRVVRRDGKNLSIFFDFMPTRIDIAMRHGAG
jgi:hypothetical protein